ncbi:hypothetical protein [Lysinibacillus capsici]|uniref:hypothetical protein n=1 Tax=Lysinibacillus capsici TaxID=2115968 RepID=UPI000E1FC69A|nr:hypothetical protein [Lysinibacillus capsici]RDV26273.1 hypothetical protein C7B89_22005 [Lysinibacillus capsici]
MTGSNDYHKALPYECDSGWVAIQNEALTLYTLHPKFNGNVFMVYAYLLKNFNHREGRSYPSYMNMSMSLGIRENTIRKCVEVLSNLDMIEVHRLGGKKRYSYYYTFKPLINDEDTFFDRFPEAHIQLEKYGRKPQQEGDMLQTEVTELLEWI